MIKPLTSNENHWVERTLNGLSREACLGQLMLPTLGGKYELLDELAPLLKKYKVGGIFVCHASADQHRETLARLQDQTDIPYLVAADVECGAGYLVPGFVPFPDPLALGAADDVKLAHAMGRASAMEGRSIGIHWTFAPVADVNVNPDNPIANTRSLGDNPKRINPLLTAILRGMQEEGLAACVKHFPGDGVDDLDHHTVTSINSLSMKQWRALSGSTFAAAIKAGVWSVMVGHIALPAWDPEQDHRGVYRPASVNSRIVTDLLRREMGFEGLVVTDDMNMGGVAGYMNRRDRTVACIKAGCDMLLFPRLPEDFEALCAAAKRGELSEERIREAARRVLELKARLGLHRGMLVGPDVTESERVKFEASAKSIAAKALVKVRDLNRQLPLRHLKKGSRVLTVTFSQEDADLAVVDEELKARGFAVQHLLNPHDFRLFDKLPAFDAIFVNFLFRASWAYQSVRAVGIHNRIFIGGFYTERPHVVFTSFGSPYHLRMYSTLPNLLNVHSGSTESQRAAVRGWLGELPLRGRSPVGNLVREPVTFRRRAAGR
jgi:beta-N-acetylhexosaminidase